MNRPAFLACFVGSAIGAPLGLLAVALLACVQRKAATTKADAPARPDSGLRLSDGRQHGRDARMTIFGALRTLATLTQQACDAASFILKPERPFFEPRGYVDCHRCGEPFAEPGVQPCVNCQWAGGADELAEAEAEREVTEPGLNPRWAMDAPGSFRLPPTEDQAEPGWPASESPLINGGVYVAPKLGLGLLPNLCGQIGSGDPGPTDSIFHSGGQTYDMGPRPKLSTPGPRLTDSDRLDRIIALLEDCIVAPLEDLRTLLRDSFVTRPDQGQGSPDSPVYPGFNGPNNNFPISSAAPASPDADDAAEGPGAATLTLGNTPSAVYERVRQRADDPN